MANKLIEGMKALLDATTDSDAREVIKLGIKLEELKQEFSAAKKDRKQELQDQINQVYEQLKKY